MHKIFTTISVSSRRAQEARNPHVQGLSGLVPGLTHSHNYYSSISFVLQHTRHATSFDTESRARPKGATHTPLQRHSYTHKQVKEP
uniref:Uncharacterized protein n=1 Tax=Anopheles albimanus TaxID=7167 RepID=A0A182FYF9_ANOAL